MFIVIVSNLCYVCMRSLAVALFILCAWCLSPLEAEVNFTQNDRIGTIFKNIVTLWLGAAEFMLVWMFW